MALLTVTVNGEKMSVEVNPELRLVDFLRDELQLTGTKIGCGKGECGACTVIMNGKAVTSCLVPVMRAEGAVIQTIEGVAQKGKLHPLQEEFINKGAIQCGFCTPGMIMSAKALLDHNNNPTREEIKEALGGNICRCTGYAKIEEAVLAAAARLREGGGDL
jgi:carbon-monoxide dehydrogenase small subunit